MAKIQHRKRNVFGATNLVTLSMQRFAVAMDVFVDLVVRATGRAAPSGIGAAAAGSSVIFQTSQTERLTYKIGKRGRAGMPLIEGKSDDSHLQREDME